MLPSVNIFNKRTICVFKKYLESRSSILARVSLPLPTPKLQNLRETSKCLRYFFVTFFVYLLLFSIKKHLFHYFQRLSLTIFLKSYDVHTALELVVRQLLSILLRENQLTCHGIYIHIIRCLESNVYLLYVGL